MSFVEPENFLLGNPTTERTVTSQKFMYDFFNAFNTADKAYNLASLPAEEVPSTMVLFTPLFEKANYDITPIFVAPEGMHGFIFTEQNPATKTTDIKIAFRGVQLHDGASVLRALEGSGPGLDSFFEYRNEILEQITSVIKEYDNVTLEISGHSLGGADATHCLQAILQAQLNDPSTFRSVKKITLNSLNAPGDHVDHDMLKALLAENKCAADPMDIHLNVLIAKEDIVSQYGQSPFTELPETLATLQLCIIDKVSTEHVSSWASYLPLLPELMKELVFIAHSLEPSFSPEDSSGNLSQIAQTFIAKYDYQYWNNQKETSALDATLDYKFSLVEAVNFIATTAKASNDLLDFGYEIVAGYISGEYSDLFIETLASGMPFYVPETVMLPEEPPQALLG